MEGNAGNGSGSKVALNVQSDLVLNQTVQDKVSSAPEPDLENTDIPENTRSQIWNLGVDNQYP